MSNKRFSPIIVLVMVGALALVSLSFLTFLVHAQSGKIPVILVHGYLEDARIWSTWEELLTADDIPFQSVTFTANDKCGSTLEHASELREIVQNILSSSGSEKVNIVAHSKGGLDSRVFLASGTDDVANLIMIGTPNLGMPLSVYSNICAPAVWDLRPGANAQSAPRC